MKKRLFRISLISLLLLARTLACSSPTPIPTPTNTATPLPTETPLPTQTPLDPKSLMKAKLDQLITLKDIATLAGPLGIIEWRMDKEFSGERQACRTFRGQSWSASANMAANCVWMVTAGFTLQQSIHRLISVEWLPASAKAVASTYQYGHDFGLYAWLGSNGHATYDGFLLKDGFLYVAEVGIGTPYGYSPETLYASEYGQPVDDFLHEVLTANLQHSEED